jgi:hypothetical protein
MIVDIVAPTVSNSVTGQSCRWQSMHQPYVFTMTRKDATYNTAGTNGSGFLTLTALTLNGYVPVVNETITVVTQSPSRKAVGKITSYAGGVITTDILNATANITVGGWINWSRWENYKIAIAVTCIIPSTAEIVNVGTVRVSPNADGKCIVDVSPFLSYKVNKILKTNFALGHYQDTEGWVKFQVEVSDSYIFEGVAGFTTRGLSPFALPFYAIDGVKQLMDKYGQNYSDYEPPISAQYPQKFLTAFDVPRYSVGYPFCLSYLMPSTDQNNGNIFALVESFTEDGTQVVSVIVGMNTNHDGLTQLTPFTSASNGEDYIMVMVTDDLIPAATPANYWSDEIVPPEWSTKALTRGGVSRWQRINVDRSCQEYPVYLMWKNSLGGWDFWLFGKRHDVSYSASKGERYELDVLNIGTSTRRHNHIETFGKRKITVGDNVESHYIKGLADIERSTAVYMLYNSAMLQTNPALAWIGVQIEPKGFTYRVNAERADIEIVIELPEYYTTPN